MMNYKTGGKKVVMPEQAKIVDPRSEKVLEENKIAKGDSNPVKGTGAARKQKDVLGINMWFSAIKLAVSAGSKIYANKQKQDGYVRCTAYACVSYGRRKRSLPGKLLEARQSDWKDEAVLIILSLPILILAWAVVSDDPTAWTR